MDKFMGVTMAMNRAMSRLERVAPRVCGNWSSGSKRDSGV